MASDLRNQQAVSGPDARVGRRRWFIGGLMAMPLLAALPWVRHRMPAHIVVRDGWILAKGD